MYQSRRRFLEVAASATTLGGLTGLAGCLGAGGGAGSGGDSGSGTGGSGDGGTGTDTATDAGMGGGPTVAVGTHPTYGDVLTDGAGRTLYLFTRDMDGASACYDGCAANWPPMTVDGEPTTGDGVDAELSTFERDDGSTQVAAAGHPLYYFARDGAPGDATGQEVGNVWFLLRPDGSAIEPTVSVREHESLGPILTDADGMTLYLFTNDEGTTSTCTGNCAEVWPPLTVGEAGLVESVLTDVELGTTEHPEAGTMATAAGHPLYYYQPDEEPGEATGQGVGGVWYVLDPEGDQVGGQATSTEAGGPGGGSGRDPY